MAGGITFDETMEGWFALGAATPEAGAAQGRTDGTRLAMHARVVIDDLDGFIAASGHPGGLSGQIDFEPLGFGLVAPRGVFQLFSPGPSEDARRMVYELGFEAGGKAYYLAGEKRVHNDPGFDIWRDTTTLFTDLHAGNDRSGPVVGGGILSLGIRQLLDLIATFKPINGGNAATIMTFGRFFFGELWEVYAPHVAAPPA
jgi:hypothetical protein